jgi:hypothetical protein
MQGDRQQDAYSVEAALRNWRDEVLPLSHGVFDWRRVRVQ